jgi:glycosyltransferase involved in cell wall biosynthesis
MSVPRVSVIIPTKNRQDLLEGLLRGLQNEPISECIVVATREKPIDYAAEDVAVPMMEMDALSLHRPGATFAQAINAGTREAKGDWLWLLNDDVILTQPILGRVNRREFFARHEVIGHRLLYPSGLIQHAGIAVDQQGNPYNLWRGAPGLYRKAVEWHSALAVTFASAFIKRDAWFFLGGLDEDYHNAYEDLDFCLRVREVGWTISYEGGLEATHLEGQSAGRNDHLAESWQHFHDVWLQTGRLAQVTGVYPFALQQGAA